MIIAVACCELISEAAQPSGCAFFPVQHQNLPCPFVSLNLSGIDLLT